MKLHQLAGWLALRRSEQIILGLICLIFVIGLIARSVKMQAAVETQISKEPAN